MGLCLCGPGPRQDPSAPFDASDVFIGDIERFGPNQVDETNMDTIESSRRAMTALELLAEFETIYRRKPTDFPALAWLDLNSDPKKFFLRSVLDEPVGRYYFAEFCLNKDNFKHLSPFVQLWIDIALLDKLEVTLEDVIELQKVEREAKEAANNRMSNKRGSAKEGPGIQASKMAALASKAGKISQKLNQTLGRAKKGITTQFESTFIGDEEDMIESIVPDEEELRISRKKVLKEKFRTRRKKNKGTRFTISVVENEDFNQLAEDTVFIAAGMKVRDERDVEPVLTGSQAILDNYLSEFAESKLDFSGLIEMTPKELHDEITGKISRFEEILVATAEAASLKIEERDALTLRKEVFLELQAMCMEVMFLCKAHEEFMLHSEYKRFRKKYDVVYNFICHRDFDYMQTLGKGSFGRVIRVRKKTNGKQYALKIMSKRRILSGAEVIDQVTIEKEVLVVCSTCPSVVGIIYAFQTSKALFLALDLLDGGTLTDAMHRMDNKKFTIGAVRTVAAQVISGLNHLHIHGILYRDLKPHNVLLDSKGNAVITDMGLCAKYKVSIYEDKGDYAEDAYTVDPELVMPIHQEFIDEAGIRKIYSERRKCMQLMKTKALKCVGTPGYRAPEILAITSSTEMRRNQNNKKFVANRNGYGHEVDYWALGVTLYYLVTTNYPFRSKNRFNLFGPSPDHRANERNEQKSNPDFQKEFANIDENFGDLISGLLTKDPTARLGHDIKILQKHPFFVKYNFEKNSYYDEASTVEWQSEDHAKQVWGKLISGEIKPAYKPRIHKRRADEKPRFAGVGDAMKQFAQENVLDLFAGGENDIIDDFKRIRSKYQKLFDNWNHTPEEMLNHDWSLLEKYFEEE